jgi:hypothetical protein
VVALKKVGTIVRLLRAELMTGGTIDLQPPVIQDRRFLVFFCSTPYFRKSSFKAQTQSFRNFILLWWKSLKNSFCNLINFELNFARSLWMLELISAG